MKERDGRTKAKRKKEVEEQKWRMKKKRWVREEKERER